ncbi:MAG: cytochrome c [Acidobacteria bacterium]|nr:cytochrome c [Acidobacteriota bacterium]
MTRWQTLGLVLVMAMAAPALLVGSGDAAAGKAVFTKKCATCHGAAGEGKDAIAKMMKVEMHHLGAKEVQAKSDADLHKEITEGTGKMKPVKGMTEEELANVIAYVRSLAKK